MEICFLCFTFHGRCPSYCWSKFHGTRKKETSHLSLRTNEKLKPSLSLKLTLGMSSATGWPQSHSSSGVCGVVFKCPATFSLPRGGVSGIDYNTKHTFQRVCVCVFARVRHDGSNIARLVAHLSPVLICLFLLDFQRNHTREKKKIKSAKFSRKFTLQYC